MTCPDGYEMTANRLPDRPTTTEPGQLVLVRVGDSLYVDGEQPESPPPRFWRVCIPDTPPTITTAPTTTLSPPQSTTSEPPTTTEAPPSSTTTSTTEPSRVVECWNGVYYYNGSDPAACATVPASPPMPATLAETGVDLGPAVVAVVLILFGVLAVWLGRKGDRR